MLMNLGCNDVSKIEQSSRSIPKPVKSHAIITLADIVEKYSGEKIIRISAGKGCEYAIVADCGPSSTVPKKIDLFLLDGKQNILKEFSFKGNYTDSFNEIMSAKLLPNERIFLDCHSTPRLGLGIVLDLSLGKVSHEFLGYEFLWNKTFTHCAYIFEPLGKPGSKKILELWIDGAKEMDIPQTFEIDKFY